MRNVLYSIMRARASQGAYSSRCILKQEAALVALQSCFFSLFQYLRDLGCRFCSIGYFQLRWASEDKGLLSTPAGLAHKKECAGETTVTFYSRR